MHFTAQLLLEQQRARHLYDVGVFADYKDLLIFLRQIAADLCIIGRFDVGLVFQCSGCSSALFSKVCTTAFMCSPYEAVTRYVTYAYEAVKAPQMLPRGGEQHM